MLRADHLALDDLSAGSSPEQSDLSLSSYQLPVAFHLVVGPGRIVFLFEDGVLLLYRLVLNFQRFIFLCLPNSGIKIMHHLA